MAEHHEDFDAEPLGELPADEAPTPMWMPALGAALFVLGGIWFVSGDDTPADTSPLVAPSAQPAATAAPDAPAPEAAAPPGRPAASVRRPVRIGRDGTPTPNPVRRAPLQARPAGQQP